MVYANVKVAINRHEFSLTFSRTDCPRPASCPNDRREGWTLSYKAVELYVNDSFPFNPN
jgi:hypothetical protein